MNQENSHRHPYYAPGPYTLLTGATGLLGRYLMRDLLLAGRRLAVLVRPRESMSARQRVEQILQAWESELGFRLPRPVLLQGDVRESNLGLSSGCVTWIQEHCDTVIHSAATLNFHGGSRTSEPWRTNLGGTENVIELARRTDIEQLHYVSTAYVCGQQDGPVPESQLDAGQSFRNDYEHSKFEAEQRVQAAVGFKSKTVYRPAVIVGDSETGYTSTYHGLFLYLRLMAMLVPNQQRDEQGIIRTPIKLPLQGDEPRNLVPIDWVSRAICHLVSTPAAHGRTYHLTPDHCTCPRDVIDWCYRYFHSEGVEFCGPDADCEPESAFARQLMECTRIYQSYDTSDPVFDTTNLRRFAGHLTCPRIDQEMIFRFLDFGNSQNWGRQPVPAPRVPRWIESQLTEIALAARKTMDALSLGRVGQQVKIGLDIHGPGGGQWQLQCRGGTFRITPGLPSDPCPILHLTDLQIEDLLGQSSNAPQSSRPSEVLSIDWTTPLETVIATGCNPS